MPQVRVRSAERNVGGNAKAALSLLISSPVLVKPQLCRFSRDPKTRTWAHRPLKQQKRLHRPLKENIHSKRRQQPLILLIGRRQGVILLHQVQLYILSQKRAQRVMIVRMVSPYYEHIADDYSHQLRCFRPSVCCVSPLARPSHAIFHSIQFVSVSFFTEFGPFYQPLKSITAGVPRSNPKSCNLSAYRQREFGP